MTASAWKLLWNLNIPSELSWVGPRWLVLHRDLSVIHWMWIQGREVTVHKVTGAAEVKAAERANSWRLSSSSTPNNWGQKSCAERRSGGHIIVSTKSTLCANWIYLLINNLWAISMDSSRPVLLNEFYRGGKLVEQTSDTATGLRGTADPHCLRTRGPAPFILDAMLVTINSINNGE